MPPIVSSLRRDASRSGAPASASSATPASSAASTAGPDAPLVEVAADAAGLRHVQLSPTGRLELVLGSAVTRGYLVANGELRDLPTGSSLDTRRGLFTWAPGVGYFGAYRLVFVAVDGQIPVTVTMELPRR